MLTTKKSTQNSGRLLRESKDGWKFRAAVADWRTTAAELRLPRRDAELFGPRFITEFQSE